MRDHVIKRIRYGIMFLFKSAILGFNVGAFMLCLFVRYSEAAFPKRGNLVFALLYFSILLILMGTYGCLRIGKLRTKELLFSAVISLGITNFFTYFIMSLIADKMLDPTALLLLTAVQFLGGVLLTVTAQALYTRLFQARDALFVCGGGEYDCSVLKKLRRQYGRFDIRSVVNGDYDFDAVVRMLNERSTLILGNIEPVLKTSLIEYCFAQGKQLYLVPTMGDIVQNSSHYTSVGDTLLLYCRNQALSPEQRFVKRAADIVISTLGVIITIPVMALTAIFIKLGDGGPVFFKQKRYTRGGKVFTMVKFRSMVTDAEKNGAQFTVDGDPRITPIGRFIRASRIDELPQLFNILAGDMSLVGPRAERVENVEAYSEKMPEFRYRLKVKAGLTGYAQLYGKYNTSFEDKARMDLYYIVNYSPLLDLKLLFYTLKVIFMKESTEGFEDKKSGGAEKKGYTG